MRVAAASAVAVRTGGSSLSSINNVYHAISDDIIFLPRRLLVLRLAIAGGLLRVAP
jgi:hypothetical protein